MARPGRPLSRYVCKTMWGFSGKTLQRNLTSEQLTEEQKVGQFTSRISPISVSPLVKVFSSWELISSHFSSCQGATSQILGYCISFKHGNGRETERLWAYGWLAQLCRGSQGGGSLRASKLLVLHGRQKGRGCLMRCITFMVDVSAYNSQQPSEVFYFSLYSRGNRPICPRSHNSEQSGQSLNSDQFTFKVYALSSRLLRFSCMH